MRGGTSRGLFLRRSDIPADIALQDRLILAAFGSPDPYGRQIDGLGGATSTTNKAAIIGPRAGEPNTVDYTFCQASITDALVDRKGNCGNISSAVGPYAVDEGMVEAHEPETAVRIYNTNTKKYIISRFPVENGKAKVTGDYRISGIPGTGARVCLDFENPGGAVTGRLLPTGNARDVLDTGFGPVEVTIVDAANPLVFMRTYDLPIPGLRVPPTVEFDSETLARIESVRAAAAVRIGLAGSASEASRKSPAVPKLAFVSPAADYVTTEGAKVAASEVDLVAWMMSMQRLASAYAITGAVCTAGAARIPGTIVNEMIGAERTGASDVRIGHPSGTVTVDVRLDTTGPAIVYLCGTVYRTARRILDGFVYVPESIAL